MAHSVDSLFFRTFETLFLAVTIACSVVLTCVLAGVPGLIAAL